MVRWSVWWWLLSFFEWVDDLLLLDHSLAIDDLLFVVKNFFSYLLQLFWPHRIDWSETFSHQDDIVDSFFWEDDNHPSFSATSVICQIYLNLVQVWELERGGKKVALTFFPLQLLQTLELATKTFWFLGLTLLLPHWRKILKL